MKIAYHIIGHAHETNGCTSSVRLIFNRWSQRIGAQYVVIGCVTHNHKILERNLRVSYTIKMEKMEKKHLTIGNRRQL